MIGFFEIVGGWVGNLKRKILRCHCLLLVMQWYRQNLVATTAIIFVVAWLGMLTGAFIHALVIFAKEFEGEFSQRMSHHPLWSVFGASCAGALIFVLFVIVFRKASGCRRMLLLSRRKEHGHVVRPSVEDELGRTPFAKSFIKRLRGMSTRQTVYVALYGKWGEGKTTVVDYISNIATMDAPEMLFVDFNPWRRLPNESFADQMFSAIAERLRIENLGGLFRGN